MDENITEGGSKWKEDKFYLYVPAELRYQLKRFAMRHMMSLEQYLIMILKAIVIDHEYHE